MRFSKRKQQGAITGANSPPPHYYHHLLFCTSTTSSSSTTATAVLPPPAAAAPESAAAAGAGAGGGVTAAVSAAALPPPSERGGASAADSQSPPPPSASSPPPSSSAASTCDEGYDGVSDAKTNKDQRPTPSPQNKLLLCCRLSANYLRVVSGCDWPLWSTSTSTHLWQVHELVWISQHPFCFGAIPFGNLQKSLKRNVEGLRGAEGGQGVSKLVTSGSFILTIPSFLRM